MNKLSEINTLESEERRYLPHCFLSYKDFKATVVNRVLSSLHGGPLEITLTVPLSLQSNSVHH